MYCSWEQVQLKQLELIDCSYCYSVCIPKVRGVQYCCSTSDTGRIMKVVFGVDGSDIFPAVAEELTVSTHHSSFVLVLFPYRTLLPPTSLTMETQSMA